MAFCFVVVFVFVNVYPNFSDGLLLTDPSHVEQRLNQMESQIQGLSQEVNALKQENAALKAQVSSGTVSALHLAGYCIQGNICSRFIFSLSPTLSESEFKTERIAMFQIISL